MRKSLWFIMHKLHKLMLINGENLTLSWKLFWLGWKLFLVWKSYLHEKWIDWGLCQCMSVAKEFDFVRYDDNVPSTPLTCFNHMHNWKEKYIQCYSQSPNQPLNKILNHPIVFDPPLSQEIFIHNKERRCDLLILEGASITFTFIMVFSLQAYILCIWYIIATYILGIWSIGF